MKLISLNKSLSNAVSSSLALVMVACSLLAAPAWAQDQSQEAPPPPAQDQPQQQAPLPPAQGGPQTAPPLSPEQLQQLVAPIARIRMLGGPNPGCVCLPNTNCRGRTIPRGQSQPEGQRLRQRGGPAGLGSQREGSRAISFGAGKFEQESLLDIRTWRREFKPGSGCYAGHPVHAQESAGSGTSADHAAADGD